LEGEEKYPNIAQKICSFSSLYLLGDWIHEALYVFYSSLSDNGLRRNGVNPVFSWFKCCVLGGSVPVGQREF
jgi:hypothetical protein